MTSKTARIAASLVLAPCIAFWLWFGIASAVGERLGIANGILHLVVPAGALIALLALAWRWPTAGGALLALAGAIVAIGYPVAFGARFPWQTQALVVATMALPPLVAGILFLGGRRRAAIRT